VVAQQVSAGTIDGRPHLSLSCNPDLTLDIVHGLRERAATHGLAIACVAQINDELPFMYGDAVVKPEFFDYVVDNAHQHYSLFCPPKGSVTDADYMIGVYGSALVRDGGELQVGIGALGDAVVYALMLRHQDNARYQHVLDTLGVRTRFANEVARIGDAQPFQQGLFAATEMLVDGFMQLFEAGIIKRKVYDDLALSRLLNEGRIDERVTAELLDLLRVRKAIDRVLTAPDFDYLVHFGILRPELRYGDGHVELPTGERFVPDLDDPAAREQLNRWLGSTLQHGAVIHAGFFLGPQAFYRWLRELPEAKRRLIDMRSVTRINQLYGHEAIDRLHRRDARFLNTCMKLTLLGAAASDALDNGTVVSGVGGQYNFVAMAHELPGGRSVLQLRSTRLESGELRSNLVWSYGHTTIPRHLRDIVITEYGIADLRGRTDEECVQAMLQICDSRFQPELMREAKRAHKLRASYELPSLHRNNHPTVYGEQLARLRPEGLFPELPFGTDLTADEQRLAKALRKLERLSDKPAQLAAAVVRAAANSGERAGLTPLLRRMQLETPRGAKERMYQLLVTTALRAK
jgi:acyl-CoA hydrolase